jgi:hypothetical protein
MLMALSGNGSIQKMFDLFTDPKTGAIRPAVYFGTCVGFDPSVTICDSKYFSQILNDTESFPKYNPLYNLHDLILGKGLVTASGDHHRRQRKLITPVFHFGALRSSMRVLHRNVKAFLDDELPRAGHVLRDSTFKAVTLGVIIDYAFSGAFDKRWMHEAWHTIVSHARTQSAVRLFLASYVRWLPTPASVHVLLVRLRIRLYLWRRRRLLRRHNITQELVLKAVEETSETSPAGPGTGPGTGGPELSIDLGMNLVDQVSNVAVVPLARARAHARTHARTHEHARARTHPPKQSLPFSLSLSAHSRRLSGALHRGRMHHLPLRRQSTPPPPLSLFLSVSLSISLFPSLPPNLSPSLTHSPALRPFSLGVAVALLILAARDIRPQAMPRRII